ncbi:conjugal transfer protein TraG N-terminal domain-containing protein [Rickettsiaceae bacterium]|nr:conjugal transfer protein TraG N-terminal domain-containing protein [Rickettsiaceae bacterium]
MDYVIYAYGGGDTLISMFNAVARIFESDSTYLTPVGQIGMMIGALYAASRAIVGGDIMGFAKGYMMPSLVTFMLLFSAKSTVWIKDEVSMTAPIKIDNIPVGISVITSLGSTISHSLSRLLEENMMPVNNVPSTHTGIMYGAKTVAKLRDVQIADPLLLQNTKEYMRQCYMKPYVMGNFGGHMKAAIEAKDILDFLDKKPVKCFGIKPFKQDGERGGFMTCTEAGKMIKQDIEAHAREPIWMGRLGASLGISTENRDQLHRRIREMTSGTLSHLGEAQLDIHRWMEQSMILNANRESYDDWREKVGHSRMFPELVKMQATRGMFQQALGSIVGGEMSEAMIPASAQPVALAFCVMCFVIILPLAMLPGGWKLVTTGLQLMLWPTTWPVFYTIIHCIGMIQLKDAIGGWGEGGLSLIGQAGFTELIMMKYASTQGMISSVPIISFAIVFGSPYALSAVAGGMASVANSMGIGANMADNNISMGMHSTNNISKNQESVGGSFSDAHTYDDGVVSVRSGVGSDGESSQVLTEHQDQMSTNYSATGSVIAGESKAMANQKIKLSSITDRESDLTSVTSAQNIDVAKSIVSGTTKADTLSTSDQESLRKGFTQTSSTNHGDTVANSKTTGTSSNAGVGIPGKILGGLISGGTSTNASNNLEVRSDMSQQEQQAFSNALDKVKTAASTNSLTTNNSEDMKRNESFAANISDLHQIGEEKAKTIQDIDTISNNISYVEQNAGAINRNVNDQVMKEVMSAHPELGSKSAAERWMNSHRGEADQIANKVIANYNPFNSRDIDHKTAQMEQNTKPLQNMSITTPDSLKEEHAQNAQKVNEQAVVTGATNTSKTIEKDAKEGASNDNPWYNKDVGGMLQKSLSDEDKIRFNNLKNEEEKKKGTISNTIENRIDDAKNSSYRNSDYTAVRVATKIVDNIIDYESDTSGKDVRGLYGISDTTERAMGKDSDNIAKRSAEYRNPKKAEDKEKK